MLEDQLLQSALERRGMKVICLDWATEGFDWSSVRFAIFRSTWDYQNKFQAFSDWLKQVETQCQLINPISTIRWNMDKHYLHDLQQKGINIPETFYIAKGSTQTLQAIHEQMGWQETVLKPTFSGGAKHTYRLSLDNLEAHETIFRTVVAEEDMMLQPLLHSVIERGEISMMILGGQYTHSVLKKAKKGDFRVQDNWGGSVHPYMPTDEEMTFAEQVVAACSPAPIYARIDIANDNDGNIALMEAELIEPELWFRQDANAVEVLVNALMKELE